MSASRTIARLAATRLVARPGCHSRVRYAARTPSLPHYPVVLVASVPCAGLATNSNPTSTVSHRPDALDPRRLLSRRPSAALTPIESKGSVLDLYRKICRLLPQVLKGYELQGEDSYHRALRNLRFYFEHHAALQDPNVVEVLRHKAEMEIEEAMLMYKTKSHVAALCFGEPQLASAARHAKQQREQSPRVAGQTQQLPSTFMQDFLAGTA